MIEEETKTSKDGAKAVSPVIGVILMVAITVTVAATTGALITGSAFLDVKQPTNSGVTFNYDYEPGSDIMKVSVTAPGNAERLYIANRNGGFDDADILKATGGWLDETADRNSGGSIVDGDRVVNEDLLAGDKIILNNVTADDELVLTADRGKGTGENLVSRWETEDRWTYTGD
jgi:flagellin-like protein